MWCATFFPYVVLLFFLHTVHCSRIAVLHGNDPSKWPSNTSCHTSSFEMVKCNLAVYEQAVATAAKAQVDLLVFPEGYGLYDDIAGPSSFFELLDEEAALKGDIFPCTDLEPSVSPSQVQMSCAAAKYSVMLATNFFTRSKNGTRHITEIVFGADGVIKAVYHKHHLFFAYEPVIFTPGPFAPTTFTLTNGEVVGIIICWEGFYVDIPPFDWDQMNALKTKGASTFVWSVGGSGITGTLTTQAKLIAKKCNVSVAAVESGSGETGVRDVTALILAEGQPATFQVVPLQGLARLGTTAKPSIHFTEF